jgi:uncharacterized membrane protein YdjX (TVP38/TMEM64 family)
LPFLLNCIKINQIGDRKVSVKEEFRHTGKARFLALILFLLIIAIVNHYLKLDLQEVRAFLERLSLCKAVFIFALIYVLGTILLPLSKDILKIIGAICLGAVLSSLSIWIAEIINAVLLFSLARYLGREFIRERLKGRGKMIDQRIGSAGFRGILILRLVPLIPYRVLDLSVGLTSFSFIQYLVIAVIGSPLRIFWIQYILAGAGIGILKNPAALVDYIASNKVAFAWSWVYLIMVIIVGFRLKFKKRI